MSSSITLPVALAGGALTSTPGAAMPLAACASAFRSVTVWLAASVSLAVCSICFWAATLSASLAALESALLKVSLSWLGLALPSLTCPWTRPSALRPALGKSVLGAADAKLARYFAKSAACALMVWRASVDGVCWASCELGSFRTAPALRRLTLLSTKASGLARSKASSIWSRDTLPSMCRAANSPAVSPRTTVRLWPRSDLAARVAGVGGSGAFSATAGAGAGVGAAGAAAVAGACAGAGAGSGWATAGGLITGKLGAGGGADAVAAAPPPAWVGTLPMKTRRPVAQRNSMSMSKDGDVSGCSLLNSITAVPSGLRLNCVLIRANSGEGVTRATLYKSGAAKKACKSLLSTGLMSLTSNSASKRSPGFDSKLILPKLRAPTEPIQKLDSTQKAAVRKIFMADSRAN